MDARPCKISIDVGRCNHVGPVNMIDLDNFFSHGTPRVDIVGCSAPVIFDVFVEVFFRISW